MRIKGSAGEPGTIASMLRAIAFLFALVLVAPWHVARASADPALHYASPACVQHHADCPLSGSVAPAAPLQARKAAAPLPPVHLVGPWHAAAPLPIRSRLVVATMREPVVPLYLVNLRLLR